MKDCGLKDEDHIYCALGCLGLDVHVSPCLSLSSWHVRVLGILEFLPGPERYVE